MKGPRFPGTGVALVTPFLDSGEIDFAALTRIVEHLTRGDVDYLVVLGTTGESATLSPKEKQQVFAHVAAVNAGRRPLVAGIGGNDTRSVVQDLQAFRPQGYDAVLSVSPYYNKPAQEGICRHYRAVAEACPLPLILYNVPGRTGMNMSAETTLRIARDSPNVIGIKEASGNLDQVMRILRDKPDGFEVISGDDAITLPLIALGATGVISVIGNAYPKTFSDMVRRCLAGDFAGARSDHFRLLEAVETLFAEGSPPGIKAYLHGLGLCGEAVRLPAVPVSDALRARIRGIMATL
jgi:4-hydroxy-tetrahydrodipicolinate synthase